MLNWNISSTTLQTIYFFLFTVEHGSMTEAAVALNVTQPLISQRISALESSLGFLLFYRDKRKMSLTPAGKLLASRWKMTMDTLEVSINDAQRAMAHANNTLSVGIFGGFNERFSWSFANFLSKRHPSLSINFQRHSLSELRNKYCTGAVDICLFPNYGALSLDSAVMHVVAKSHMHVVASVENKLTKKQSIRFADLSNQEFAVLSSDYQFFYEQAIINESKVNGFTPNIKHIVNEESLRLLLSLNKGIIINTRYYLDENIAGPLISKEITDTKLNMVWLWSRFAPQIVCENSEILEESVVEFFNTFN